MKSRAGDRFAGRLVHYFLFDIGPGLCRTEKPTRLYIFTYIAHDNLLVYFVTAPNHIKYKKNSIGLLFFRYKC